MVESRVLKVRIPDYDECELNIHEWGQKNLGDLRNYLIENDIDMKAEWKFSKDNAKAIPLEKTQVISRTFPPGTDIIFIIDPSASPQK